MPIEKLSPLLINQIAAGEVIDRPAGVVKELVENSLDAGASSVQIAIEDGGQRLIRVSDDGSGIEAEQLVLAVSPHATSKLSTPQGLTAISTLGFRGEALASIASVSRLRVTSRATIGNHVCEAGTVIEASGDEVTSPAPAGCSPGTIVEVRDLFFNTPARRKFLRSATTEFGHIADIVTRIAMSRPHVGFKLTHGSKTVIDLPPAQTKRRRCVDLIGQELDEVLLEFETTQPVPSYWQINGAANEASGEGDKQGRDTLRVWGLAGMPITARSTSKYQFLYVNGRSVKDRSLSHAVKEAYRGLIAPNLQPVAVVFLDVPPQSVDVNVHPTKAEVRFQDSNKLHGLVLTALRQRLLGTDLTPSADLTSVSQQQSGRSDIEAPQPQVHVRSPDAFVDYFKEMDPKNKGFVYEQVKQAMVEDGDASLLDTLEPSAPPQSTNQTGVAGQAAGTSPSPPASQRVLQVHQSYLVTEDDDGLLIVDQHALHERVMFEQLRQRITAGPLESQRLLTPVVVKASPSRIAALETLGPLLVRIGIEAEPIGPEAIAIHAFASFLFDRHVNPDEFLSDLLDQAEEGQIVMPTTSTGQGQDVEETSLHQVLDMMACKAAVKAGDRMTPDELDALLAQRSQVERSSSCPHGRPTTYRITLKELAKQFKRT